MNYPNAHWLGVDKKFPQICQGRFASVLKLEIPVEPSQAQKEIIMELQYICFSHNGQGMFALNSDWGNGGLYWKVCTYFGYPEFVEEI